MPYLTRNALRPRQFAFAETCVDVGEMAKTLCEAFAKHEPGLKVIMAEAEGLHEKMVRFM